VTSEERGDRFRELEETYRDYTVYDQHYERIGRVDDVFVDENDRPEYIGVKTGFLGMKSTLIPMDIARINDRRRLIEVAADKHTIESAPAFDDNEEITPDHEARIYGYFGLEHPGLPQQGGGYGDYYDSEPFEREDLASSVDTEYGERRDEPITPPSEETYEEREVLGTQSASGPIEDEHAEAGASPAGAEQGGGTSSDEPARFEETSQSGAGDQAGGQGGVRVYKRVRGSR
jgi:hypothetical protein